MIDFSWFFGFFYSFLNSLPLSIGHRGKRVRMMHFNWTKHFFFRKIFEDILFFFRIFTFWIGIVRIIVWIKHFWKKLLTAKNFEICFDFRKFVSFRTRTKSDSSRTRINVILRVFQVFDKFSTKSKIPKFILTFLKIRENFGQSECAISDFWIKRRKWSQMKAHDLLISKMALILKLAKSFSRYQTLKVWKILLEN